MKRMLIIDEVDNMPREAFITLRRTRPVAICDTCGCLHRARGFMCDACREAICWVLVKRAATAYRALMDVRLFGIMGEARRHVAQFVVSAAALPPIALPLEICFSKFTEHLLDTVAYNFKLPRVKLNASHAHAPYGRWWDQR